MPNPKLVRRPSNFDALAEALSDRIIEIIHPCTNSQIGRLIGVSDETIRRIRHGDQPSIRVILGLCHAFDVSADWLLLGRGDAPKIDHQAIVELKTRNMRTRDITALNSDH